MSKYKKILINSFSDLNNEKAVIFKNTTKNILFFNSMKNLSQNIELSVGIDEAGRGCVLGHMLICALFIKPSDENILKEIGCKDSKELLPEKRVKIFDSICSNPNIGFIVKAISPAFISENALKQIKYNLNNITIDSAIELVTKIESQHIKYIYADAVGSCEKYTEKFKSFFKDSSITITSKADSKFSQVGAASICAKVIRDYLLDNWVFIENITNRNYGSGYTSDEVTIKWLNDVCDPIYGFPNFVRFNWSTCDRILTNKGVKVDWNTKKPALPKIVRKRKKI